jgi:hypothetical protein
MSEQYWAKPETCKTSESGVEAWWYANYDGSIDVYVHPGSCTHRIGISASALRKLADDGSINVYVHAGSCAHRIKISAAAPESCGPREGA